MASTRDIRRRIRSVKNTAQITKAMQMVAASKMRKAQEAALAGRPYAEAMNRVLASLANRAGSISHPFLEKREIKRPCALVISTDKGLCGALNTNLLREVAGLPKNTVFVTAYKIKQISQFLIEQYLEGKIDSVSVFHTRFVNTLVQKPERNDLLPIGKLEKLEAGTGQHEHASLPDEASLQYIYEPSGDEVLSALLPAYIHFQVYQLVLDAKASEHSARMVAMKSATDNAKGMIKDLTLEYNKVRQSGITTELLEIATAQMAMA
ncbi:MAG: F0F1 ATP synthase subunit gamma [Betaproteobacteria bacterium]|nr:F0F1 ATP synthase subunit gamma [Betaproteobacteria bacterium]